MIPKELLKQRPNVDDFPLQPYGYIAALTSYIEKLEQLDLTAVSHCAMCNNPKENDGHNCCEDCGGIVI
jgi:hypothetical protein